jgi:hypothetical protein
MEPRVKATARVRVVIDLPVGDTWGSDCSVAQVQEQARQSALGILRGNDGLKPSTLGQLLDTGKARIVGEPDVTAILVDAAARAEVRG